MAVATSFPASPSAFNLYQHHRLLLRFRASGGCGFAFQLQSGNNLLSLSVAGIGVYQTWMSGL